VTFTSSNPQAGASVNETLMEPGAAADPPLSLLPQATKKAATSSGEHVKSCLSKNQRSFISHHLLINCLLPVN